MEDEFLTIEDGIVRCNYKTERSVVFPEGVTSIGRGAFDGCTAVESITSASPLFPFDDKKGTLYDVSKKTKKVIFTLEKEKLKKAKIEQVQFVSADAVLGSILQEHHVENVQVRKEAKEMFVAVPLTDGGVELCLSNAKVKKWMQTLPVFLDKVNAKASKKELLEYAEANDLPDAIKKYLVIRDCSVKLKKDAKPVYLSIPEDVTAISENAFEHCKSLVSVVIPKSVKSIGDGAFSDCTRLTSVVIPEVVKSISNYAFYYCQSLTLVVIPESVTEIGNYAFKRCESLVSVMIPMSVKAIGNEVFRDCSSLAAIEFSGTVAQWEVVKKGEKWNKGIPATVVKCSDGEWQMPVVLVENGVVVKCIDKSETSVVIPEGVMEIGEDAFNYCQSLSSVIIPDGVKSIGERAFYYCYSLSSVMVPNGVAKIGECAFLRCKSLMSVMLPASVTEIGKKVFAHCKSLATIEFGGTAAQWEAVEKGEDWNSDVPAKTVKCSDGEVEL